MTQRTVAFPFPVCGKRTAELVGEEDGHHICRIGNWTFKYVGASRELFPGDELPPLPPPIDPGTFKSRMVDKGRDENDSFNFKLDRELGIKPKPTRQCHCGCGGLTASLFVPGHDMRVKGMIAKMRKGDLQLADVPEIARTLLTTDPKWVDRMKEAGL